MSRRFREQAILEVIEEDIVRNQAQLVERLGSRGFPTTQATVSRDIKKLGLIKRPARSGGYRYASPDRLDGPVVNDRRELRQACEQFLTKIDTGGSLLVLKTPSGRANALAVSIDECGLDGIVGTLAGDDTVLLIMRETEDRDEVRRLLAEMAG